MRGLSLAFELVTLILLGVFLGYYIDKKYQTKGLAILILTIISFLMWTFLAWRSLKR